MTAPTWANRLARLRLELEITRRILKRSDVILNQRLYTYYTGKEEVLLSQLSQGET